MYDGLLGFCTRCGCGLKGGEARCPECGAWLDSEASRAEAERVASLCARQLKVAAVILLACAAVAVAFGAVARADPERLAGFVVEGPLPSWLVGGSWSTVGEASVALEASATSLLLSGVCGAASAVLTLIGRRYWVVVALCSVAIVAGPSGLIWLFAEFLAFWTVMSARYGFKEYGLRVRRRSGG